MKISGAHQSQVLCVRTDRLDRDEQVEELVYGGSRHVEGQHPQKNVLHLDQFLQSVVAVCDVHKIVQLRMTDLLVFPTR